MPEVVITLIGKPDCHLCEDARNVISAVTNEVDASPASRAVVRIEQVSILEDNALFERFAEEIPVVLINGAVHTIWRVDPGRFRSALNEALELSHTREKE